VTVPRLATETHDRYKWIALSNTTLGVLIATVDGSIVIISLPAIFRGIGLDPLAPGNIGYLLWMILGHLLAHSGVLATLPPDAVATLTGNGFFPDLVSVPFHTGLVTVLTAATAMALIAAVASLLRGRRPD
jgi:hypothetical protein